MEGIVKDLTSICKKLDSLQLDSLQKRLDSTKHKNKHVEDARQRIVKWLPEVRLTMAALRAMYVIAEEKEIE